MYFKVSDVAVNGRFSASVSELIRPGEGRLVATFYGETKAVVALRAERMAKGWLDGPVPDPVPAPTPVADEQQLDEAPADPPAAATPAALALCEAHGLDPGTIHYTGQRLTKNEVEVFITAHAHEPVADIPENDESAFPSGE